MIYTCISQTQIGGDMDRINGGATTSGRDDSFPTEDELIVAQILLDLKHMMSLIDSLAHSDWKRKRRRSCLDPVPPIQTTDKDAAENRTTISPDSPFLLAQTDESDEKSKHSSNKTSAKTSKKDHLDMIQQFTRQKDSLQGEIDNVKKYCKKLMAYNSQLKTIKQKISIGTNVEIALTHLKQEIQYPIGPIAAHLNSGLNREGPIGFDLNVPAQEALDLVVDELQPLDMNGVNADERARSAEARKMRKGIMKMKSIRRGVSKMS